MGRADEWRVRSSPKARMTALKALTFSVCFALSAAARAQTQSIEYSRVFSVRHLAGVAVDSSGATVAEVKVEICKDNWTDCFSVGDNQQGRQILVFECAARERPLCEGIGAWL